MCTNGQDQCVETLHSRELAIQLAASERKSYRRIRSIAVLGSTLQSLAITECAIRAIFTMTLNDSFKLISQTIQVPRQEIQSDLTVIRSVLRRLIYFKVIMKLAIWRFETKKVDSK